MAEPINLRQARKQKARAEKDRAAEAARLHHGRAKTEKKLSAAQKEKVARDLAAHKREKD
ncbi:MAG: DUF4169 family protein [Hyphomonadaceae bacterium]